MVAEQLKVADDQAGILVSPRQDDRAFQHGYDVARQAQGVELPSAAMLLNSGVQPQLEIDGHFVEAVGQLAAKANVRVDNDRLWIERIERRGNQITVTLNEAIWQGKYFKTFTFYHVYGVKLGKLPPGEYEASWVIAPLTFKQFEGDGRPASFGSGKQIDNWSKDEAPAEKKPVELRTKFRVVAAAPGKD